MSRFLSGLVPVACAGGSCSQEVVGAPMALQGDLLGGGIEVSWAGCGHISF